MQKILYAYQKKPKASKHKHIYLVKYSAFMSRIIFGGGGEWDNDTRRCTGNVFLTLCVMDAFTVSSASPVCLPLPQSYHRGKRQVVALSLATGRKVRQSLPG